MTRRKPHQLLLDLTPAQTHRLDCALDDYKRLLHEGNRATPQLLQHCAAKWGADPLTMLQIIETQTTEEP